MSRFVGLVCARLAVAAFFLLTAAYTTVNCSPFAFDMFIRPQLIPSITSFVAWHHILYCAAYALSVVTLVGDLDWRVRRTGSRQAAHYLAIAYVIAFGVVGAIGIVSPFLATLWNDSRALPMALASCVPLAWLGLIDHLSMAGAAGGDTASPAGSQRRVLTALAGAALYLWIAHAIRAVVHYEGAGARALAMTSVWALALVAMAFAIIYTIVNLANAIASGRSRPQAWARWIGVLLGSAAVYAFLRVFALPTISLNGHDAEWVSAVAGISLGIMASGLVRRRPPQRPGVSTRGAEAGAARWATTAVALLGLGLCASLVLGAIERIDWAFLGQRVILIGEAFLAYLVVRRAGRTQRDRPWTLKATVVPPAFAVVALLGVPYGALGVAAATGDRTLEPAVAFDRWVAAAPLFRFLSEMLVTRASSDDDYLRFLQVEADASRARLAVPDIDFSAAAPASPRRPDIFVLVIDSLRRDYVAPYNPAVTFTPNIARLANDSLVFRNAFTRHGGTALAAPSIWAGAAVVRKIATPSTFERVDAFEKFVNANGYRMAVNDYTIASSMRRATPATTIDPDAPSLKTDLCQNLQALASFLDATSADPRPVFTYLSPMNLHVVNTRHGHQGSLDSDYPGFYAPYASRLRRIDACLGTFVSYLRQRNLYDNSIIVVTSDHGDSLGENGYWGHGTWLFPEVVRVPLIIRVPTSWQPSLTTDLSRIAFTADIAPTLYALTGHAVRSLGPPFGEPLFVPRDQTLSDRRRDAFLVTSSYGATYGLVSHNGRGLYVTDLVAHSEFAYDLSRALSPRRVPITADMRRADQRRIRTLVTSTDRAFGVTR